MRFPLPGGDTVYRLRAEVVVDPYGDEAREWGSADRVAVYGVAMAPTVEPEFHQAGRDGVEVGWTLYCAYGSDVTAYDRIEHPVYGLFEVDGDPGRWKSPFSGLEAGMTVRLRRIEG